jgi:branched-chain amino acid transport system ATP-binding protein
MKTPILEVSNLSGGYGLLQVIWNLNFTVRDGEIVCLIGANGAGKTTTLRLLSGLGKPMGGEIKFKGVSITGQTSARIARLGMAHVPEGRKLFGLMTVQENLEVGANCSSKAWQKKDTTMNYVYTLFPILRERATQAAGTLSGGEQQMLAIARALMTCPSLLLVDEPSMGLAPSVVENVFKALKEVVETGVAIFLIEQDVKRSLRLAERGYVLENGHIVAQGTSSELMGNEEVKKAYLAV